MKQTLALVLMVFGLVGCSMPQEEKENIAAVTCSIMSETRNMDAAVRVRELNEARDKIGGEPFLRGDVVIKEAFEWELCQELVLNEIYDERLQSLKDAKRELERIAAEKRAEEQRIYLEKLAEEQRIAAEEQRIAAEKQRIAKAERMSEAERAEAERAEAERIAEELGISTKKNFTNIEIKNKLEQRIAAEEQRIAAEKQRIAEAERIAEELGISTKTNFNNIEIKNKFEIKN